MAKDANRYLLGTYPKLNFTGVQSALPSDYLAGLLIHQSIRQPASRGLELDLLELASKSPEPIRQIALTRFWLVLSLRFKKPSKNSVDIDALTSAIFTSVDLHTESFNYPSPFLQPLIDETNKAISFILKGHNTQGLLAVISYFTCIQRTHVKIEDLSPEVTASALLTLCKYKDKQAFMEVLTAIVEVCEVAMLHKDSKLLKELIYVTLSHVLENNDIESNPVLRRIAIEKLELYGPLFNRNRTSRLHEVCGITPAVFPKKDDSKQKSRKHAVNFDFLDVEAIVRRIFKRIKKVKGPPLEALVEDLAESTQDDKYERVALEVKQISRKIAQEDIISLKNFSVLQRFLADAGLLEENQFITLQTSTKKSVKLDNTTKPTTKPSKFPTLSSEVPINDLHIAFLGKSSTDQPLLDFESSEDFQIAKKVSKKQKPRNKKQKKPKRQEEAPVAN